MKNLKKTLKNVVFVLQKAFKVVMAAVQCIRCYVLYVIF